MKTKVLIKSYILQSLSYFSFVYLFIFSGFPGYEKKLHASRELKISASLISSHGNVLDCVRCSRRNLTFGNARILSALSGPRSLANSLKARISSPKSPDPLASIHLFLQKKLNNFRLGPRYFNRSRAWERYSPEHFSDNPVFPPGNSIISAAIIISLIISCPG